ncbi:MAG TPA: hypothetical protein PLD46_00745 [Hyphomicrobium sp.]|nr:hypothetical protein [Hyphomicrobium sp.]
MMLTVRSHFKTHNGLGLSWKGQPIGAVRALEIAAAAASIGMILAAAALPDDDDKTIAARMAGTPASSTAPYAPGREQTFGAYLGAPYHYPSDFHLKKEGRHDLTIPNVEWFTKPFDNPLYYGARIQRWMDGGRFGTMVDFTHSKAYAPMTTDTKFTGTLDGKPAPELVKVKDYFDKLEFSHGHNMLTLNGLMRLGSFGQFSPYVGLGGGISLPHSELHLKTDPTRTYEYQYTGLNGQALLGLEFRLKTGSIFLEYKFTLADYEAPITHRDGNWLPVDMWRQFSRWWSGDEPPGGWASTRLTSHQVIGGFYVRFAPQVAAQ